MLGDFIRKASEIEEEAARLVDEASARARQIEKETPATAALASRDTTAAIEPRMLELRERKAQELEAARARARDEHARRMEALRSIDAARIEAAAQRVVAAVRGTA